MKRAILVALALFASVSSAMAVIEFKGGLTHDIDYEIDDDVWVDYQSPGMGTTVNVLDGGSITPYHQLSSFENSIINISGGDVSAEAWGNGTVNITGGSIISASASYYGMVNIHDNADIGSVGGLYHGNLNIYGSNISEINMGFDSIVNIYGGSINDSISGYDNSEINVYGYDLV